MLKFLERYKTTLVYFPLVIYWLMIFTGTSLPSDSLPTFGLTDKLMHFGAYFGLSVLLNLTLIFQNKNKLLREKNILFTLLIVMIYAGVDELHQNFIPGRFCEFLDFAADLLGGILGIGFVFLLQKIDKYFLSTN